MLSRVIKQIGEPIHVGRVLFNPSYDYRPSKSRFHSHSSLGKDRALFPNSGW